VSADLPEGSYVAEAYNLSTFYSSRATGVVNVLASVASDVADPESDIGAALSATIDGAVTTAVPPLLIPAFARAGVSDDYVWTGDSLSAQGGGTGVAPGSYLAVLTGREVDIDAVGGETTAGIAARLNAAPLLMAPEGGTIPISGAVKVTLSSPTGMTVWPLLQTAGNPAIAKVWVGTLAGVHGTFSLVQPAGASANHQATDYYNFTRTTPGSSVVVSRPAPFLIDYGVSHAGKFHVIWAARNDLASSSVDTAAVLATLDMMTQKIIAEGGDFVVLSVLNGAGEGTGTAAHTRITSYNDQLAVRYPQRYIDIRGELIDRGLTVAGLTPTTQDNTDIANDIVPDSLRTDTVHLEVVAREAVAKIVHEYLRYFGRIDAPAVEFVDDFNRADSASLGTGWVAGHDYQIVSNQLTRVGTSGTAALLVATADLESTDMEVSADVVTRGGSTSTGLVVRYVDANNFIGARIAATLGNVLLYRVVGGVTTSMSGLDGSWPADGARLTLRAIGNTFTVFRDGVQILTSTVSVPEVAASTKVAIRTASAASKPVLDNFQARGL
jgi:hypothetical protein